MQDTLSKMSRTSTDEGDADRMAEKPEDSRKVAGGTRERKGRGRQASAVVKENARPKAEDLLEEVLRRENLLARISHDRCNKGLPSVA